MKKFIYTTILLLSLSNLSTLFAQAQEPETKALRWSALRGLEYRLKAGFNLGGTSPLPLPAEIRSINSYNPTLQFAVEGNIVKWFNPSWGLLVGLRLENKGMKTDALVKNYGMKMVAEDGGQMEGYWTGNVTTEVSNAYITFPLLATYKINKRWEVKAGGFISYQSKGQFTGHVYDGYLRHFDPTGEKVVFEGNSIATYDFSKDLRNFQCGLEVGVEWRVLRNLNLSADLTWGVVPIFNSNFETITFSMFPIYANIGFAYVF